MKAGAGRVLGGLPLLQQWPQPAHDPGAAAALSTTGAGLFHILAGLIAGQLGRGPLRSCRCSQAALADRAGEESTALRGRHCPCPRQPLSDGDSSVLPHCLSPPGPGWAQPRKQPTQEWSALDSVACPLLCDLAVESSLPPWEAGGDTSNRGDLLLAQGVSMAT